MLSALTQVAETGNATVDDPAAQFGAGIVAQLLPEERQRDVLLEFTRALSEEWATWFEDAWTRSVMDRRVDLAALQSVWDQRFAGPLRPYLERHQLDQGALIVSPQVGWRAGSSRALRRTGRTTWWWCTFHHPGTDWKLPFTTLCASCVSPLLAWRWRRRGRCPWIDSPLRLARPAPPYGAAICFSSASPRTRRRPTAARSFPRRLRRPTRRLERRSTWRIHWMRAWRPPCEPRSDRST